MDRSFLSDKQLIKASRDFVCIRTATYEDKEEAKSLEEIFVSRGGSLRNFGYRVLSPDGKKQLRRSEGGPNFVYADSAAMAADLGDIASQYRGKKVSAGSKPGFPQMKSVRLGVNVASCEGLPSVVVFGKTPKEVARAIGKLSEVIWDEDLAGKFVYASTSNPDDLKIVSGVTTKAGILVIKPDAYGIKGELIEAIDPSVSKGKLKRVLVDAADSYQRISKTHGTHVRNGRRTQTSWETAVPVPDRDRSRASRDR